MTVDPFLTMVRSAVKPLAPRNANKGHAERAHSKYSASGAERWFNCPGSVELSEGLPDKSSPWAIEGTECHEVLEALMRIYLSGNCGDTIEEHQDLFRKRSGEMFRHASHASNFMIDLHEKLKGSELMVETRIRLDFIHPEMFGTFDGAVVDLFGTLHVFDFKYGAGHAVGPKNNLQMIFYGIGLAHQHHWNFKRIRLWIIQPRIRGYDGPMFWELTTAELKAYVGDFRAAVKRVEEEPESLAEGAWCHWCKAKSVCPLKQTAKLENAIKIFSIPKSVESGKKGV